MSTWVIGDVQGCFRSLSGLLEKCAFNPTNDRLWFVGDLVNRGPRSLETLDWVYRHRKQCTVVLGNHDLHLLMRAEGLRRRKTKDTLDEIIASKKGRTLLKWLRKRPLLHVEGDDILVHAGLLPKWSIPEAIQRARKVEAVLKSGHYREFLAEVSGADSSEAAAKWAKEIETVAIMTRMRTVDQNGSPHFDYSGPPESAPKGYSSWFEFPHRRPPNARVLFGHWAALGYQEAAAYVALDSGCVWGNALTAFCLEESRVYQQSYCD